MSISTWSRKTSGEVMPLALCSARRSTASRIWSVMSHSGLIPSAIIRLGMAASSLARTGPGNEARASYDLAIRPRSASSTTLFPSGFKRPSASRYAFLSVLRITPSFIISSTTRADSGVSKYWRRLSASARPPARASRVFSEKRSPRLLPEARAFLLSVNVSFRALTSCCLAAAS